MAGKQLAFWSDRLRHEYGSFAQHGQRRHRIARDAAGLGAVWFEVWRPNPRNRRFHG